MNLFGPHLRLYSKRYYGNEEILYAKEHLFSSLRWFSFGSNDVIAHWTFFCEPKLADAIDIPTPPNCITNTDDFRYNGTQWTTVKDLPCIPWIANEVKHNFFFFLSTQKQTSTNNSFVFFFIFQKQKKKNI